MGYSLSIGEAVITWDDFGVSVDAKLERHDDAPAFGEPTDYENQRWPSYTAWSRFCETIGIKDLMFDSRNGGSGELAYDGLYLPPLINHHPGHTPIQKGHLGFLEGKVEIYRDQNPDHIAQFPPVKEGCEDRGVMTPESDRISDARYDPALCSAEWLLYWMRWSLDTCEHPVFVNT